MSRGHFQPTILRKNALKRCKMKEVADNVVLIDVDSDNFDEVIIIDGLESLQQKARGPSVLREGKKPPFSNIISIDDESTHNDHPGVGLEGRGDLDTESNSSKKSNSTSNRSWSSVGPDGDECEFIRECNSHTGKAPCRNRYGLSTDSESGSSESDCSDCEVMEGSFGKLREQWEKAFTKRKYHFRNVQSGLEDQASASSSPGDAPPVVEVKNSCELHPEVPVCSCSSEASYEKDFSFAATGEGDLGRTSLNPELGSSFAQYNCKVDQERFSSFKAEPTKTRDNLNGKGGDWFRGETSSECPPFSNGGSRFQYEEPKFQGPTCWSDQDTDDKRCDNGINFQEKAHTISGEPCEFNSNPSLEIHSDQSKTDGQDKEASSLNSQHQNETQAYQDTVVSMNKEEEFYPGHPRCDTHSINELRCESSSSGVEEKAVPSAAPSEGEARTVLEDGFFGSIPPWSKSEVDNDNDVCQANKKSVFEESSMCSTQCNKTHVGRSYLGISKESESESKQPEDENNGLVAAHEGVATPAVERDIINERERLKETEEYKRAIEEEWASRQRQLQIQAEEAQRLRKRRRAESMRLLDMERRQKQRLEEVRATQKQDEENMNLKEQLRGEIRKELKKLEFTCKDMASVLRSLGIHVGGGVYPSPHEVHAAYKRALLRFHPDRASRNNIRQQVEAEEKFKLMSRMKESLLWTS